MGSEVRMPVKGGKIVHIAFVSWGAVERAKDKNFLEEV